MLGADIIYLKFRFVIDRCQILSCAHIIINIIAKYKFPGLWYIIYFICRRVKMFIVHRIILYIFRNGIQGLGHARLIHIGELDALCISLCIRQVAVIIRKKDPVGILKFRCLAGILIRRFIIIIYGPAVHILVLLDIVHIQIFRDGICDIPLFFAKEKRHVGTVSRKEIASGIIAVGILLINIIRILLQVRNNIRPVI